FFPTLSMMLDILPETPGPLILDVRQNGAGPDVGTGQSGAGRLGQSGFHHQNLPANENAHRLCSV
ncbi:hypothetical protein AB0F81_20130, partial [Actinoplanes sp. NPDC024001]|uniref:hypothetical protein n=1 Tax=Actinoplanes sp. NPDC024001 TaxID=3154598 RepID=UPI0033EE6EF9